MIYSSKKLAHCDLTNKKIALLKSYLSNRKLSVQLSDVRSSVRPNSVGVLQGSILGPLLFNIFINDNVTSGTKFNVILFADDTTLNSKLDFFGQDTMEIQDTIVAELQNIFKWLDVNRLCLNVEKYKFMLFHMPRKKFLKYPIAKNTTNISQIYHKYTTKVLQNVILYHKNVILYHKRSSLLQNVLFYNIVWYFS